VELSVVGADVIIILCTKVDVYNAVCSLSFQCLQLHKYGAIIIALCVNCDKHKV